MEQNNLTKEPVGFLLLNKPAGMTSRDCVNQLQRMLPKKTKIGHGGTLDRFATGLLIIGIGRPATRMFSQFMKIKKTYWVRAKLGELTDTMELTGIVLSTCTEDQVPYEKLKDAFQQFPHTYKQTPPTYSALKWQGKRLSDIARSQRWNEDEVQDIIQKKTRDVHVYDLNLISYVPPYVTFSATVSGGTYVRALAHDIARQCNSVATTYELKRTAVGPFKLEDAVTLDAIETQRDIISHIMSVSSVQKQLEQYAGS